VALIYHVQSTKTTDRGSTLLHVARNLVNIFGPGLTTLVKLFHDATATLLCESRDYCQLA